MTVVMYEVGGAVRDSFLSKQSSDIDYAVEAPSFDAMRKHVLDLGATIFVEHPQFVTIRAKLHTQTADFTLCRKEGEYYDNRHPSSCEPGSIMDDLARRDFTMNAIARNFHNGGIIDPYNGVSDIKNKLIKCVGDPNKRFQEDALRILRALRFSITLGFEIHRSTWNAICLNFELLKNISSERIRDELGKMFKHDTINSIRLLSNFIYDSFPPSKKEIGLNLIFNERTGIWLQPTMKDK